MPNENHAVPGRNASNSNLWIFCIRQHNWASCRDGPESRTVHGDHMGSPWQGIGANSKISPENLRPGDIVVARRTTRGGDKPHGAMGVWRYKDQAPVTDQNDVPWTDGVYKTVLYCENIQTLSHPINEKFGDLPFHQNQFLGAMNRLSRSNRRAYIDRLFSTDRLGSEAEAALRTVR